MLNVAPLLFWDHGIHKKVYARYRRTQGPINRTHELCSSVLDLRMHGTQRPD